MTKVELNPVDCFQEKILDISETNTTNEVVISKIRFKDVMSC